MAKDHNDKYGGLFDFNGDGKTDIFEEWFAYKSFEEIMGEEDDRLRFRRSQHTSHSQSKPRPLPEHPTEEEYLSEKYSIENKQSLMILFVTLLMLPFVFMLFVYWSTDFWSVPEKLGYSLWIIIPAGVILFIWIMLILAEKDRLEQLEKNYRSTLEQEHEDRSESR